MKPIFCISILTLAACGVTDPLPTAESEHLLDSAIASTKYLIGGAYEVTCVDGSTEIDSAEQIAAGLACVDARMATAHFSHMWGITSSVTHGTSGPVTNGVDITLKVIGTNVSAVFFDRSFNYPRPLTADTVALAPDGSFTATATVVEMSPGCPSTFGRNTSTFRVSGQIDADGAVALDDCRFDYERAVSTRRPFTCDPDGNWIVLTRVWYDELAPAEPTTLSE